MIENLRENSHYSIGRKLTKIIPFATIILGIIFMVISFLFVGSLENQFAKIIFILFVLISGLVMLSGVFIKEILIAHFDKSDALLELLNKNIKD